MGSLQVVPPGKPRSYYSHIFKLLINSQIVSSVVIKFMKFPSILAFLRVCIRNGWWILSVPKIRKANLRRQRVKSREWSPRRYYATDLRLAAAAVVSNSVQPHRRQPTRLPHPWDSSGKNTGVGCHVLLWCMKVKSESEVAQSCLTLPGSSVHGIFQTRVLEWGAIAFSNLRLNLV